MAAAFPTSRAIGTTVEGATRLAAARPVTIWVGVIGNVASC
jgi:hypothetical protein